MFAVEMIQHLYLQAVPWSSIANRDCRELAIANSHDWSGDVSRGAYAMLACVPGRFDQKKREICFCLLLHEAILVPASVLRSTSEQRKRR